LPTAAARRCRITRALEHHCLKQESMPILAPWAPVGPPRRRPKP
jgi:hypothetical protein